MNNPTALVKNSLPDIYEALWRVNSPAEPVTCYQYDHFIKLWQDSIEFERIVLNCRSHDPIKFNGRLLNEPSNCESLSAADLSYCDLMGRAIALSIGELLWMIINHQKVVPLLELITPLPQVKAFSERLSAGKPQPWVSIYFPTCAAYFFETVDLNSHDEQPSNARLVGWADELFVAEFKTTRESLDSKCVSRVPRLYPDLPLAKLVAVPNLLMFRDYYEKHNAEIVCGYMRIDSTWKFLTINGKKCDGLTSALAGADQDYVGAVESSVKHFRPAMLARESNLSELFPSTHKDARMHARAYLGSEPKEFALTLTHSLHVIAPEATNIRQSNPSLYTDVASSFLSCLITVPTDQVTAVNRQLSLAFDKSTKESIENQNFEKALALTTKRIWDSIYILKLPISRAMASEAIRRQKESVRALEVNQQVFNTILPTVTDINEAIARLQIQVQYVNSHVALPNDGLFTAYPNVSKLFIQGYELKLPHRNPLVVNHELKYGDRMADAIWSLSFAIHYFLGRDPYQFWHPTDEAKASDNSPDDEAMARVHLSRGVSSLRQLRFANSKLPAPVAFLLGYDEDSLNGHVLSALGNLKVRYYGILKTGPGGALRSAGELRPYFPIDANYSGHVWQRRGFASDVPLIRFMTYWTTLLSERTATTYVATELLPRSDEHENGCTLSIHCADPSKDYFFAPLEFDAVGVVNALGELWERRARGMGGDNLTGYNQGNTITPFFDLIRALPHTSGFSATSQDKSNVELSFGDPADAEGQRKSMKVIFCNSPRAITFRWPTPRVRY